QGFAGASLPLPAAATTSAPCRTAYSIACCSTPEKPSTLGSDGSRVLPRLRLITRARWPTAQRIARASARGGIVPAAPTTLAAASCPRRPSRRRSGPARRRRRAASRRHHGQHRRETCREALAGDHARAIGARAQVDGRLERAVGGDLRRRERRPGAAGALPLHL